MFFVNPNVKLVALAQFFWRKRLLLLWLVVNPTIRQGGIGMASWWASRLEERSLCCVTPYACTRNPRA
jgi:hypothetical protein